jgi:hypothetical protein
MAKAIRAEQIQSATLVLLERDQADNMANYVRRLSSGNIEVKTLYRYGKPSLAEYTPAAFDTWRVQLENISEI